MKSLGTLWGDCIKFRRCKMGINGHRQVGTDGLDLPGSFAGTLVPCIANYHPTSSLAFSGLHTFFLHSSGPRKQSRTQPSGVLVKFDQLTFKANTYEGTNVIATNGSQLMQMLPRDQQPPLRLLLKYFSQRSCAMLPVPKNDPPGSPFRMKFFFFC